MVTRADRLKVSFTEDELEIIRKRAEKAGFMRGGKGNVAAYLRALALSDGENLSTEAVPQRIVAKKVPYKRALKPRIKEVMSVRATLAQLKRQASDPHLAEKAGDLIAILDDAVTKGAGEIAMEHWFAGVDDAIALLSDSRRGEKLDFDRIMSAGAEMAYKGADRTAGFLAALAYWAGDYRPEDARWPMVHAMK